MRANPYAAESVEDAPIPKPCSQLVARQPILTGDQKIYGYELLFRDGLKNYVAKEDTPSASRNTLDVATLMGLDVLCDGQLAFINCTRDDLLRDYVTLLPSAQTVVEVMEVAAPDESVIAACRRLKKAGYLIALDDFEVNDPREPLVDLADIIKVDVKVSSPQQCATLVKRYAHEGCRMLAKKVETPGEFAAAQKAGFDYFQGYFFRRPELRTSGPMPANRAGYLRLLQVVSGPEFDPAAVEKAVKSDASFCYRLLRYLNSASFGLSNEIHSVRHAISMLGESEFKRWVRMVATFGASNGKCSDLLLSGLVRARFCERMPAAAKPGGADLFFLGLLSVMDSVLEMPMARVLKGIPVAQDIKGALLGEASPLRPLYRLMLELESGEWQEVKMLAQQFRVSESELAEHYWEAMQWARQISAESCLQ
jgi:EAL and modified HD-GYP domain-containing signal transduction protein